MNEIYFYIDAATGRTKYVSIDNPTPEDFAFIALHGAKKMDKADLASSFDVVDIPTDVTSLVKTTVGSIRRQEDEIAKASNDAIVKLGQDTALDSAARDINRRAALLKKQGIDLERSTTAQPKAFQVLRAGYTGPTNTFIDRVNEKFNGIEDAQLQLQSESLTLQDRQAALNAQRTLESIREKTSNAKEDILLKAINQLRQGGL